MTPDPEDGLLLLDPGDTVAMATRNLQAGCRIRVGAHTVVIERDTPTGHKIAIRSVAPGERILKYRVPIGSATRPLLPGDHVHTHNMKSDYIPTYTLDKGQRFEEDKRS